MEKKRGISKIGLIALVVSSSIGSGIFGITNDLAMSAAPDLQSSPGSSSELAFLH